ncbi:hypothetical protein EPD60_11565 [Flaviaesturariibacter flavus]|uniref:Uncharacterized protein n=1 Tax=Flaviaesturariibacter flavus TaxID=2502780 RepID=A0A4R1B9X4_9BACT|nr:hypothetical protein [Flaviaesturariibacter flavus]TCJ13729.1 hypothetical protein EPD60_11565 [Flaviaesturariibacter flavus]
MAYSFTGFIGTLEPVQHICRQYIFARGIPLGQEIFLVPLTEELQEQMNDMPGSAALMDGFEFLTQPIESVLVSASAAGPVAYAEVSFWAGEGNEAGIIWQDGSRVRTIRFGRGVINAILKYLGCTATEGLDEFDTMGFGMRRFTDDWLKE